MRGLKHLYVYYLKGAPAKIALYEPFNNRECLHCHGGARSFEETTPHKEMKEPINSFKNVTLRGFIASFKM
jgi:hypothetical protein